MTDAPPHDDARDPALPGSLATLLREHAGADRPLESAETGVDARVDDAVMSAARERLGAIEPPKTLRFPLIARVAGGVSVAAAAVGLVVYFGPGASPPTAQQAPTGPQATANDLSLRPDADEIAEAVERSGDRRASSGFARAESEMFADAPPALASVGAAPLAFGETNAVTILDAYALALAIDNELEADATLDANRDGRIDRADVDALAARAVKLGERVSALPFAPPPAPHGPWSERFRGSWTLAHFSGSVLP
ncbi:MAG: hypothetical protein AAGH64_00960 [Planctomycetota bacterium]